MTTTEVSGASAALHEAVRKQLRGFEESGAWFEGILVSAHTQQIFICFGVDEQRQDHCELFRMVYFGPMTDDRQLALYLICLRHITMTGAEAGEIMDSQLLQGSGMDGMDNIIPSSAGKEYTVGFVDKDPDTQQVVDQQCVLAIEKTGTNRANAARVVSGDPACIKQVFDAWTNRCSNCMIRLCINGSISNIQLGAVERLAEEIVQDQYRMEELERKKLLAFSMGSLLHQDAISVVAKSYAWPTPSPEAAILRLLRERRAAGGLPPLEWD